MATIHATPDERDPRHHTAEIEDMLNGVIVRAREDVSKVDDPQARALFETTAEVLTGLVKAYEDFDQRTEPEHVSAADRRLCGEPAMRPAPHATKNRQR